MIKKLPTEYIEFINECKLKDYNNTFTHKHHILPRFMGGTDDESNIVLLGVDDHFKAHYILAENCDSSYSAGAWASLNILKRYWSGDFEEIRDKIREAVSGDKNGMYGKTHTDEYKRKMSERMLGDKNPMSNLDSRLKVSKAKLGVRRVDMEGDKNPMSNPDYRNKSIMGQLEFNKSKEGVLLNKKRSEILLKGNHPVHSTKSVEKMRNTLKERASKMNTEERKSLTASMNKRKKCVHCGKEVPLGALAQYHGDKCKNKK